MQAIPVPLPSEYHHNTVKVYFMGVLMASEQHGSVKLTDTIAVASNAFWV